MKRFTMFACLALALVFALSATAGDMPRYSKSGNEMLYGGSSMASKASRDSFLIMGGTGRGAGWAAPE